MMPWFALIVKSRQEKVVALALGAKYFETLLPLYRNRNPASLRRREFISPVFPGYVFCRFEAALRRPVVSIPGVISIVSFGRVLAPIADSEILALQTLAATDIAFTPCAYYESGDRVRLDSGPLRGIEGIIDRRSSSDKFIISVNLLRRSVSVVVQTEWLSPIDEMTRRPGINQLGNAAISRTIETLRS
jgi:transcription termination/antitermination protein NusG